MRKRDRFVTNIVRAVKNIFNQFQVDPIEITDEDIDYYRNYYLKEIPHDKYTTDK